MIRKLLKALLFVPLTLAMVLGIVACGGEETPGPGPGPGPDTTYEDYYVIDTSSIRTQVQCGEEFSLPITVTNLGEEVEDPNYSVKIVLGTTDVTSTAYDATENTAIFADAGVYTVTFTILKEDGSEATDKDGAKFTESVQIEAMGLRIEGLDDEAVTVDNERLSITFGQAVADGTQVGQYSLKGATLSGDFEFSFKVSDMSFLSNSSAKLFVGFVRNTINAEEDSFSIGAKDKQFHACVMNVAEAKGENAASWNTGAFGFIDSKNTVLDTSGTHEIKIERKIVDGSAIWSIYYDGELFNTLYAGSEYSDVISRIYFTASQCGGTVSDIDFTGMITGGAVTERADTDVFDLSTTSGVARANLGYQVYIDVYEEEYASLLSGATVKVMYNDNDVTETVYDAADKVFLAEEDGEYQLIVTAEKNGVTYSSTKTIVVWEYEASMYAFGEVDAAFGADLSNITVGTNGAIRFEEMTDKSSPKINYLTNVSRNYDIEFTAEGLEATAENSRIEFTMILTKNDTFALFFDDMFIYEDYAFAARINSVSSDLIKYAAVSNGLDGVTVSDQFNPGEGVNVPANTNTLAEHTYKIACRTDDNNIVTYYYFLDGNLFAKHNTSVYNGTEFNVHNNVSTLLGFQIKSTGMNATFKNLTIKNVEYSVPEASTEAFDLSETTDVARTGVGMQVYYTVKSGYSVDIEEANATFTLDGADVTADVYNAETKVFRANAAGEYIMTVACGDWVSTKKIVVSDTEAHLYKFSEFDSAWGQQMDKTVITKDGIRFENMSEGATARYNYVTNVANCWEITFKTKNLSSVKENNNWPCSNIQMTLIIGSDTKQGLVFDDIMLECFPNDDCWGWAATLSGTDRVAYAWAAWGVGYDGPINEFKPSEDYSYESVSYLAEHTWRIVCNMDENGIVTFYYYMDGALFAIDNTSTQLGRDVNNHTGYSRLFGAQFYANSLNGEVYDIQINELTSFEVPGAANVAEVQAAELDYDLYCGKEEEI